MTSSVTLSVRLPAELRDRLRRASAEQKMTMSGFAVALVREGLDGGDVSGDGPLVAAITEKLDEEELATPIERETALALARIVEAGGMSAVSAVKELRNLLAEIAGFEDDDPDLRDLHIPE